MKCFNHPVRDAVAICKACGKAVCPECGLVSENGMACRQRCARILAEKNATYAKLAAHHKNIKRQNVLGSVFSIGMGILFMYFSTQGFGLVYDFVFLLGAGFTVYGIVVLLVNMVVFLQTNKKAQP